MSIKLVSTKEITLEAELLADLENEKANEADYIEFVKNPERRTRPPQSLSQIRDSIEILTIRYEEAKKLADKERAKLGTADEIRKIIADMQTEEETARKAYRDALGAVQEAERLASIAHQKHSHTIGGGIRKLLDAGVPSTGAELDGEPITYGSSHLVGGGFEHGDTHLRYFHG